MIAVCKFHISYINFHFTVEYFSVPAITSIIKMFTARFFAIVKRLLGAGIQVCNNNNDFISIALFHAKHAQLR